MMHNNYNLEIIKRCTVRPEYEKVGLMFAFMDVCSIIDFYDTWIKDYIANRDRPYAKEGKDQGHPSQI